MKYIKTYKIFYDNLDTNDMVLFDNFNDFVLISESKNIPTNKKLWAQCKAWAKRRYDVWPSAYAVGAAAKRYKEKGGEWKKEKNK